MLTQISRTSTVVTRHLRLPRWRLGVILATCIVLAACGPAAGTDQPEPSAIAVRVAAVNAAGEPQALRFAGTVRPRQRAELTFQVGGVLQRRAEVGQVVVAGDSLAQLYNPELEPARDVAEARLRELQTQVEQAQRDVTRATQLFERAALSAQELEQQVSRRDALQAAVTSAEAGLRQATRLQSETGLLAPFDGSIVAVLAEPGEFLAPGQPVMRLAAASGFEVEVRVPPNLLNDLQVGDSIPVWPSLGDGQWQGRVVEIGQSASQGSLLYPLIVALQGDAIQAGEAVEVALNRPGSAQLSIPLAAVMRAADGVSVFRINNDRVQRVPIDVLGLRGEYALLDASVLRVGDQVVYAGLTRLSDGDRVELLP